MKTLKFMALALTMLFGLSVAAHAAEGNLVKKIESFDVFMDYSGSMVLNSANTNVEKLTIAKQALKVMNSLIPDLGYDGALHTVAPVSMVVPHGPWNQGAYATGIDSVSNDVEAFARMTPLGNGIHDLSADIRAMKPKSAVIIVSDGENNRGSDPVAAASAVYSAAPETCFHIISVADTEAGQTVLDNIAKLNACSVSVKASDLIADEAAAKKFVADVFYTTEAAPIVADEDVVVLRGVNFAFDSSALDSKAIGILTEAATLIKADAGKKIVVNGWTDWIGTDAYNMKLSLRRADAVKDFLIKQGVSASNLLAVGHGKSFKYDNNTDEGRALNRRVEFSME